MNDKKQHYNKLAEQLLFERLDHKYVLNIDKDMKGCTVLVEHYNYLLSPAVLHLRWK
ncbi:hypothetical protein D3C87_324680 [compost metagenome]